MRPIARALRIADGQLGVVTRAQLVAVRLSGHQIRHLLDEGVLVTVFLGVYRTRGTPASFEQRCLAAAFAAGDGAVVSHLAAGALRKLVPVPEILAVTVPEHRRVRRHGLDVHHCALDDVHDRAMCGLVPVTSPARTLLDISPMLEDGSLELVSDDAFRRGLVTPPGLVSYLERPSLANKPGIGRLRRIARDRTEHGIPQSWLETHTSQLVSAYRLPVPSRQFPVRMFGRNVVFDLAYPEERVAIEPEGWAPHWGRARWQADHDRYNAVELGAWRVLRFTFEDVTERPAYVAFVIAEKMGLRPVGWRRHKDRQMRS